MGGSSSFPINVEKIGLFGWPRKKDDSKGRTILINSIPSQAEEASRINKHFCDNRVITSHYTWWNFFPVDLYEQFHIIANFFFLLVSILYFFGETPINPLTTIAPLVTVIGVSMIKDAVDDMKRHKTDREFNRTPYLVLAHDPDGQTSRWENRQSQKLRCGDIIVCFENNSFPCDMLLLASSHSNGKVYITTDNLDGESSVKTTNTLSFTQSALVSAVQHIEQEQYEDITINLPRSTIVCQNPNDDLKSFEGSLNYEEESTPLSLNNLVLRGSNLRHTSFILGVAVYTGADTKLSLNGKPGFRKFSSSSGRFNAILLGFMVFMFLITLLTTILHFAWRRLPLGSAWYILNSPITPWRRVEQYLTLLFIINYLIPISIMVTMEFQQLLLALFISKDIEFYDPETNEKAQVNATNLADELGQIEFLFSDKTGTLTQNKMIFKSYSLANDPHIYNVEEGGLFMMRDDSKTVSISETHKEDSTALQSVNATNYFSSSEEDDTDELGDSNIWQHGLQTKQRVFKLSKEAKQFWLNVVLCHSIEAKIKIDKETNEEVITYNAASPDEKALVDAAAKVGLIYLGVDETVNKAGKEYNIRLVRFNPGVLNEKQSNLKTRRYRMDAVLEFNSVRKRMSVMIRDENGRCFVYTKGAEVAMLDPRRCGKTPSHVKDEIIRKVTEFAMSGLRILVFSVREVDSYTYESLLQQLKNAQCQLGPERARAIDDVSAKIESQMTLIGVSGVEDKLQPGVKRCLQSLISAGIQVWVLTGDKEETAVQISQATGHFPPGTTLIRLTNGQSVDDVGRAIYVQLEGMKARLEVKRTRNRFKNLFKMKMGQQTNVREKMSDSDSDSSVSSPDSTDIEFPPKNNATSVFHRVIHGFRAALADGLRRHRRKNPGGANEPVGLVIDGTTLRYAIMVLLETWVYLGLNLADRQQVMNKLHSPLLCYLITLQVIGSLFIFKPVLRDQFLCLCMNVTTVLCCRMTPLQKAAVVRLVSHGLDGVGGGGRPVTAAVGDGGNDVAMLLEASVGVGIFGNEGRQAVRASDYALPLFRHLRRLILVHGHWNYYRISMTANIFYFKNVAFVAIQIYRMFYDGFSGQSMFDSLLYTFYNLTFTSFAPFVFGIFEQHVSSKDLMHRPYLYRLMNLSANLRCWYILLWIADGWWHGTVIYYVCHYVLAGGMNFSDAHFFQSGVSYAGVDFNMFGNACYIYVVVTGTVRIVVMSRYLNRFIIIGLFVTGVMNLSIMFIYQTFGGTSTYMYMNYVYLASCPAFWLCLPLVLALTLLPGILWRISSDAWWDFQIALSGVKRIRERRKRYAWQNFVTRVNSAP
ncbi:Putative phospholipid-transporting ATPase [Echinococcus granulosus]|uniref:Phospholipid-transporting ATPase n=1 Tax=Echinococcus granulosus TaxID=6210 RepID=W6USD6_ECHGR|nr:Putative phospholipid-transporting ATPase [Echinococcus granulosus]EUB61277.1 Putative phospholipid-transporting ATPase [Echinococcus granulosus]